MGGARMGSEAAEHMYFINHFSFGRGMGRLFSTHPPTEERIERLLAMGREAQRSYRGVKSY
jgi:heat shock protein HtpX